MPSESVLFLNTHLVPTIDLFFGLGTSFQTSFLSNSFSSSCIAVTQSASLSASSTFLGSSFDRKLWYKHSFWVALLVFTPASGSPIIKSGVWLLDHFLAGGKLFLELDASPGLRLSSREPVSVETPPEMLLSLSEIPSELAPESVSDVFSPSEFWIILVWEESRCCSPSTVASSRFSTGFKGISGSDIPS